MTTVSNIYAAIDAFAPFSSCESFDNVGLLIGEGEQTVKNCLITLDVTHEAIQEAIQKDCQLIITHHPVIFHPMKCIPFHSVQGELLAAHIAVLSAHTNMDKAPGGVNWTLADIIGLTDFTALPDDACAGIGNLPFDAPVDADTLAEHLAKVLSLQGMRLYDSGKKLKKAVLCCGGGGSCVHEAIDAGADVLIAGDFKHDQVVDAANAGLACIDCGHFETERHFLRICQNLLAAQFPDVQFIPAESCRPHFVYQASAWTDSTRP